MTIRNFSLGLAGLILMLAWPILASAHVHMEKSIPENNAHLTVAPKTVQIWFSGKIAAEWSKIQVTNADGKRMDTGDVTNDGDPKFLSVKLQELPAGKYDVELNVISGDGHRVKGSFSFTVE